MKKQIVTRAYKMGDPIMILKALLLATVLNRDVFDLAEFGIEPSHISDFEADIATFQDNDADEELQGIQAEATEVKDAKAEEVKTAIRKIMVRVQDVHPENTARYRRFKTKGLSEMEDAYLLATGIGVAKKATKLIAEYASAGLTAAIIANLTAANNDFEAALEAKEEAVNDRDVATEDRIELGNALYAKMIRFTNFGKQLWVDKDEAKYNDYVIYDTPNGEAPVPEPVV